MESSKDEEEGVIGSIVSLLRQKLRHFYKIVLVVFVVFVLIVLIGFFVVFPIIFKCSVKLQEFLVFNRMNTPRNKYFFERFSQFGLRNMFVPVAHGTILLGTWHITSFVLMEKAISDPNFDYDYYLKHTDHYVLLYFHGAGEARSDQLEKYTRLRIFFHIITFDYRNFGDSSEGLLTEDTVVSDCIDMYRWLLKKTDAPIIFWGHSLGTALAARTAAVIFKNPKIRKPVGVVLESGFTNFDEELLYYPFSKCFSWLPWFDSTIRKPLKENGLIFNTSTHILDIDCPIMLLCAQDDPIVPCHLSEKLYHIVTRARPSAKIFIYQFQADARYGHFFLYCDDLFLEFVRLFLTAVNNGSVPQYLIDYQYKLSNVYIPMKNETSKLLKLNRIFL